MTRLEVVLRLSVLQAELPQIADALDERGQRVVVHAANGLNLLQAPPVEDPVGPLRLIVGGRS